MKPLEATLAISQFHRLLPQPKDPSRNPNPMESNPSSCLAKSGKRDNSELPHIANKPARTTTTWAHFYKAINGVPLPDVVKSFSGFLV